MTNSVTFLTPLLWISGTLGLRFLTLGIGPFALNLASRDLANVVFPIPFYAHSIQRYGLLLSNVSTL